MAGNNRKNMGKVFEKEFKDSVPDNVYLERYKDDTSGFYGVSNPADFRLYVFPMLILLELKTHKGKSLPLAKIRENQLKGMLKAVDHYGVYGGYLVNFRGSGRDLFSLSRICKKVLLLRREKEHTCRVFPGAWYQDPGREEEDSLQI